MESSTCTYVCLFRFYMLGMYVHGHECMHKQFVSTVSRILFPESSREGSFVLPTFVRVDPISVVINWKHVRFLKKYGNINLIIYFLLVLQNSTNLTSVFLFHIQTEDSDLCVYNWVWEEGSQVLQV